MVNTSKLWFCLSRDNPGIMLFLRTRQFAPLHCTSTGVFVSPMGTVEQSTLFIADTVGPRDSVLISKSPQQREFISAKHL